MKIPVSITLGWLMMFASIWAAPTTAGTVAKEAKFSCDLDGDGIAEQLGTFPFTEVDGEAFSQIRIYRADGTVVWSGPRTTDFNDPLALYSGTGERSVELFDDLDGDGRCELIVSLAYTEIDLVFHHRFRWNGHGFDRLSDAIMRQQSAPNGGHFIWEANAPRERMFHYWYVISFKPAGKGMARADLVIVTDRKEYSNRQGSALLRFGPEGADLVRWINPPPPPPTVASSAYKVDSGVVQAYKKLVHRSPADVTPANTGPTNVSPTSGYTTRISAQDHYNSRGRRLRSLRSILRQDRFNFYRFGGDAQDSPDRYGFSSKSGRNFFSWATIVPVNSTYRQLENLVINGNPLLGIRQEGNRLYVEILR